MTEPSSIDKRLYNLQIRQRQEIAKRRGEAGLPGKFNKLSVVDQMIRNILTEHRNNNLTLAQAHRELRTIIDRDYIKK